MRFRPGVERGLEQESSGQDPWGKQVLAPEERQKGSEPGRGAGRPEVQGQGNGGPPACREVPRDRCPGKLVRPREEGPAITVCVGGVEATMGFKNQKDLEHRW